MRLQRDAARRRAPEACRSAKGVPWVGRLTDYGTQDDRPGPK